MILDVDEIKTAPLVPFSHPFIKRLVDTNRRGYLDQVRFWSAMDLTQKLEAFQQILDYLVGHASICSGSIHTRRAP